MTSLQGADVQPTTMQLNAIARARAIGARGHGAMDTTSNNGACGLERDTQVSWHGAACRCSGC